MGIMRVRMHKNSARNYLTVYQLVPLARRARFGFGNIPRVSVTSHALPKTGNLVPTCTRHRGPHCEDHVGVVVARSRESRGHSSHLLIRPPSPIPLLREPDADPNSDEWDDLNLAHYSSYAESALRT
jgi:hypothetical protein